jgi:predicted RNA-binding Zn ribbon-like protein
MSPMQLRNSRGTTSSFDPGAFCLEFAQTGGEGYRAVWETLHVPADLQRWIGGSIGIEPGRVTSRELAEGKRLREAIWSLTDASVDGRPYPRGAIDEVNRAAARPPLVPRIDRAGRRGWVGPVTSQGVLSTVARDAVDLFTGPRALRIRRCEATNCGLTFADTSRSGRRRWCSMERCGNRTKVRGFRDRQRKEESR